MKIHKSIFEETMPLKSAYFTGKKYSIKIKTVVSKAWVLQMSYAVVNYKNLKIE